ncbi:MAG: amidohydrolase family protein [Gemmatimonadaceae bacterium]|nr:amidohydrolase family protein [Chitinophagaceae bacterium]
MRILLLLLFFPALAGAQTFITNVSVLDVETQKIIADQTVEIKDGKISNIKPSSKFKLPAGATPIDGKGKFLMPGLVDAHIHFFQSGGVYARPDAIDLRKYRPYLEEIDWAHRNMDDFSRRYLKAGITTVIDVGSTLNFLKQRDTMALKAHTPGIFMTGPLITTWEPPAYRDLKNDEPFREVKNEEDARAQVRDMLSSKPDFIKIWYIIATGTGTPEQNAIKFLPIVKASIDEAHKNNLRVAVHATERIAAKLAVENGADFLVHGVDDGPVSDSLLQLLVKKKTVVIPTLTVATHYGEVFAQATNYSLTDYTIANPAQIGSVFDLKHLADTNMVKQYRLAGKRYVESSRKEDTLRWANLSRMVKAGVIIATGTDAGNIGTHHASSYFEELSAMKIAGMSNWQILQASTINGAKVLAKDKETGSVKTGKDAELLLLSSNPAENLQALSKIDLIFHKGNMLSPDSILKETPLALVDRQLNAYNGRNLEAFLEPYAEDIELYEFPNKLVSKGKAEMRKNYSWFDKVPELHCHIVKRIINGNTIIDHELVTGFGKQPLSAIAIYEIEGNKIRKVYFIQ